MLIFGKSVNTLIKERDALQTVIDAKAGELAAKYTDQGYLVSQLMPFTTEMQRIKRAIRDRTPLSELKEHLEQLREGLKTLPPLDHSDLSHLSLGDIGTQLQLRSQRMALESEIMEIDYYLKFSSRHEPLTWKSALIIFAIVAALVVLPNVIVRWLSP